MYILVSNHTYPLFLPSATLHAIQDRTSSYLVNIRPGWDDLKSYLITTGGRRRYKVYVCTMAGRDYALEAWRLLETEGGLISSEEISQHLICVRPGKLKPKY